MTIKPTIVTTKSRFSFAMYDAIHDFVLLNKVHSEAIRIFRTHLRYFGEFVIKIAPCVAVSLNNGFPVPATIECGSPVMIAFRQYRCCSLYQQTGWDPFPCPVAAGSRSVSVATDSGHNSYAARHIPGCLRMFIGRVKS